MTELKELTQLTQLTHRRCRKGFKSLVLCRRWPCVTRLVAQLRDDTAAVKHQTWAALGRSHSASFDHRRRPEMLRTAMAMAFF